MLQLAAASSLILLEDRYSYLAAAINLQQLAGSGISLQ